MESNPKQKEEENLEWIFNMYKDCSNRYIEAESKLLEIMELPFYKRIFCKKIIFEYLCETYKKYKF